MIELSSLRKLERRDTRVVNTVLFRCLNIMTRPQYAAYRKTKPTVAAAG